MVQPSTGTTKYLFAGQMQSVYNNMCDKYNEEGMVEIYLNDGLVANCEIRSLLHYLREDLVYKHRAFYMEPAEKVGLLNNDRWHVTPQTMGLYARRRGWCQPENAEYIECSIRDP